MTRYRKTLRRQTNKKENGNYYYAVLFGTFFGLSCLISFFFIYFLHWFPEECPSVNRVVIEVVYTLQLANVMHSRFLTLLPCYTNIFVTLT